MASHSFRRFCTRLLLLLVVAVFAAIVVLPLIPLDRFKPRVESALSRALGRSVTIAAMHLTLVKRPALIIDGLTAKEDPRFGEGNLLEADHARAELAIGPLLAHRQIIIRNLVLDSPRFTFSKTGSGLWSWATIGQRQQQHETSSTTPEQSQASPLPNALSAEFTSSSALAIPGRGLLAGPIPEGIDGLEINQASVSLVDKSDAPGWNSTYNKVSLAAKLTAGPPGAAAFDLRAEGTLTVSSTDANGAPQLTADLPFNVEISAASRGGLSVQGNVGPGNIQTVNFAAQNFKSQVSLQGQKVAFDQVEASLYEGDLQGAVAFDMADPKIGFDSQGSVHNLNIDQAFGGKLGVPGKITGHINADFKLHGEAGQFPESIATISGSGHMSSNDLVMAGVNLGQQMTQRLGAQLGDMRPGLAIGHAESGFEIQQGLIKLDDTKLQAIGGLGDATADQGWLKITAGAGQPAVEMNFSATITLSAETTKALATSNPLYGAAIALLQSGNRLTVPVSITGDARQPDIQVDVSRILQNLGRG
jgi:uncharacterized protein involved in outer membrane biogenesis